MRGLIVLLLLVFLSACSLNPFGSRSEPDRVQDRIIQVGPPDAYLQCDRPIYLTEEQIEKLALESELVEVYIVPAYQAHKACYENMQDIAEWKQKLNQ